MTLSWTKGDFAKTHQVYVGTDKTLVDGAGIQTAKIYRGTQTGTSYKLTALDVDWFGPLVPDTTYYWKITEVNGTMTEYTSPVWSFKTAPYVNIDDFEDYNNADDISVSWSNGYTLTGCGYCQGLAVGYSGRALTQDGAGKYLRYTYINDGSNPGLVYFSEAKRPYSGGTSFTGGGMLSPTPKALRVDYLGSPTNAVDPTADRMYVAIEDTAGNVSVCLNPDASAALATSWTSWYSNLATISAAGTPNPVNLEAISGFAIGFGVRCDCVGGAGGDGNVMFDNIRLYAATCVPAFGPSADLDEDCDVDINDMDVLATDWLKHAETFTFPVITQPATPPVLWYKFDDSSLGNPGNLCADSGTSTNPDRPLAGYAGTVQNWIPQNWNATGSRNGTECFHIPATSTALHPDIAQSFVAADTNALDFMSDDAHSVENGGGGISFSVWINADLTAYQFLVQWCGLFSVGKTGAEVVEVHCPSNMPAGAGSVWAAVEFDFYTPPTFAKNRVQAYLPLIDYGGRWNHFAFVKEPSRMSTYCNGQVVAHMDANGLEGDPNAGVYGQLFTPPITNFRIATRGRDNLTWVLGPANSTTSRFMTMPCQRKTLLT